ncbi:hypothetical protein EVAR_43942_1 [Eumeta japonica]|uniref:Uncharacterized protein n=1 Tax=Eumeta variegata TaxID=151549 RepID=A0A4C1WN94_EUMVA|nr:hypothetical protein EVAR_43942_1 [Eumeta japonica]
MSMDLSCNDFSQLTCMWCCLLAAASAQNRDERYYAPKTFNNRSTMEESATDFAVRSLATPDSCRASIMNEGIVAGHVPFVLNLWIFQEKTLNQSS